MNKKCDFQLMFNANSIEHNDNKINLRGCMTMQQQRIFIFSLLLILISGIYSPLMAGKVGYINLEQLVKESVMGKAAMADLEQLTKEKQSAAQKHLTDINNLKLDLKNNSDTLKEQERKDRLDELNELIKTYKRMVADAKEEIAKENRELVAKILKKADGALKKVAKKEKYTMIVKDPNAIGYLDPSVDITDQVLKEFNKK